MDQESSEVVKPAPMTNLKPARAKPSKRSAAASKRSAAKALSAKKKKPAAKAKASGKLVATTTRSGKKIKRAKAGGRGVMAKKDQFALVAHIPRALHAKAWAKVRNLQKKDESISLSSWLQSVIARASK